MSAEYESHAIVDDDQLSDSDSFYLMQKLPALLRILGTGALLVAMYTFLFKGWQSGSDTLRYFLMLGHTGVLTIIGLASGHWLKESKGARLLLSLSLVSIPANFAILGAFIFSQSGSAMANYPSYVTWAADSMQSALMTTGVAVVVLIPITLLGFTVLARSISKRLSALFLISNLALLLPIRDPVIIGLMVLALALVGIVYFHHSLQKHAATRTREGMTALFLQALPLGVLIGRTLWLYSANLFLLLVMTIAIFLFLRQLSAYLDSKSSLRNTIDLVSVIPAIGSMPATVALLVDTGFAVPTLVLPIATILAAGMIYDIAHRNAEYAAVYRWLAAVIVAAGLLFNMSVHTGTIPSIVGIAAGLGLLVLGYRNRQRSFFIIGSILMLVGILKHLIYLVQFFDLGSWASLAVLGVLAIVVGSVIEAKGKKIQYRFVQMKDNFLSWEG